MGRLIFAWIGLWALAGFAGQSAAQENESVCVLPAVEDVYAMYLQSGDESSAVGQHRQAVALYGCAIDIDPARPEAYKARGKVYLDYLNNLDRAIEDYTAVIERTPDDAIAYNNRGWAYQRKRLYTLAISDYDRAVEIDPALGLAYNNRGTAYVSLSKQNEAMADFQRAAELGGRSQLWALNNLGLVYRTRGQMSEALRYFREAVAADTGKTYADPYYWLGQIYFEQERFDQAAEAYESYIKLAGPDARPHAHEQLKRLDTGLNFVRLLPLLFIAAIVGLSVVGTLVSVRRKLRAHRPTSADVAPRPQRLSPTAAHTAPSTGHAPAVPSGPPVGVLLLVAAAVGALVYVLVWRRESDE